MNDKLLVSETQMRKYIQKLDSLKYQEDKKQQRMNILAQIVKLLLR